MCQPLVQRVIALNKALREAPEYAWWRDHEECFVRNDEFDKVQAYNRNRARDNTVLTLAYPFEAVIGNPLTADIIFFSNNPGVSQEQLEMTFLDQLKQIPETQWEDIWTILGRQADFFNNYEKYENKPFRAHILDPNFVGLRDYWRWYLVNSQKSFFRLAKPELSDDELDTFVMNHVAFVELGGYHSTNFDGGNAKPTQAHMQQTAKIIQEAIKKSETQKKIFVLLRGKKYWLPAIPELEQLPADQCFFCGTEQRAAQNVYFTTGNIQSLKTNDASQNDALLKFISNLK